MVMLGRQVVPLCPGGPLQSNRGHASALDGWHPLLKEKSTSGSGWSLDDRNKVCRWCCRITKGKPTMMGMLFLICFKWDKKGLARSNQIMIWLCDLKILMSPNHNMKQSNPKYHSSHHLSVKHADAYPVTNSVVLCSNIYGVIVLNNVKTIM